MKIGRHPRLWDSAADITGDLWWACGGAQRQGHCLPGGRGRASRPRGGVVVCLFLPRRALGKGKEDQSEYSAP